MCVRVRVCLRVEGCGECEELLPHKGLPYKAAASQEPPPGRPPPGRLGVRLRVRVRVNLRVRVCVRVDPMRQQCAAVGTSPTRRP